MAGVLEDLIGCVEAGIKVLRERDGLLISDALARERARNIVVGLMDVVDLRRRDWRGLHDGASRSSSAPASNVRTLVEAEVRSDDWSDEPTRVDPPISMSRLIRGAA